MRQVSLNENINGLSEFRDFTGGAVSQLQLVLINGLKITLLCLDPEL